MASALMSEDVEPKPEKAMAMGDDGETTDRSEKMQNLKKRAFISPILPEDFLRVLLDQRQIAENKDSQLAHQLQYGSPSSSGGVSLAGPGAMIAMPYGQFQPIDYGRGRLQINVIEAKLNKNYGWITRMDPYVRIKIGTRAYDTLACYNGNKNPIWKKAIVCYLPRNVDSILLEIFDERSFGEDEMIAFVKLPLAKSLFDGIFFDEWIPLSGKLGEEKEGYINLQMLFTPLEELSSRQMPRGMINLPSANHELSSVPTTSPSSSASSNLSNSADIVQPSQVQLPIDLATSTTETNRNHAGAAVAGAAANSAANPPTVAPAVATGPVYTEEDLNAIQDMFPQIENEVIKSMLELNRGNKEAAIEALLQMNQ